MNLRGFFIEKYKIIIHDLKKMNVKDTTDLSDRNFLSERFLTEMNLNEPSWRWDDTLLDDTWIS